LGKNKNASRPKNSNTIPQFCKRKTLPTNVGRGAEATVGPIERWNVLTQKLPATLGGKRMNWPEGRKIKDKTKGCLVHR
jgi:hypothetical protein